MYFQAEATGRDLVDHLTAHRALMTRLRGDECTPAVYAGLADLHLSHPDFVARYERLAPRFSQWLPAVMKVYSAEIAA